VCINQFITMSTAELKYSLFKAIDSINDGEKLKAIYSFITKKNDVDFWDELSDEQKTEIEESIAEMDRGEGIPHEQVMKEIKTKYKL
jgi:predicted transcriptional regulator